MKNLNQYIKESILDDEEDLIGRVDEEIVAMFIMQHYEISHNNPLTRKTLDIKPDKGGFVVNVKDSIRVKYESTETLTSLTNGMFRFGKVYGNFICDACTVLETLEGAPEYVENGFSCNDCKKLETLEGAPKKVENWFFCRFCDNLKSLKGAPEFIGGNLILNGCNKLKDLKYFPKHVGVDIRIPERFSEDDVRKYVKKFKGKIIN